MLGGRPEIPGAPLSKLWQISRSPDQSAMPFPNVVSELPQTNTIVKEDRVMQGKAPLATDGWMRSVISGEWQLISHEKYGDQIYDWKSDPAEVKDLINTAQGQAARARMKAAEPK
jgi:hypothetical protein